MDEGALARAGLAHKRDDLAGLGDEGDVLQDGRVAVAEGDVAELHAACAHGQVYGPRLLLHGRRRVQNLKDAAARSDGVGGHVHQPPHALHRNRQHAQVTVEGHQRAHGQLAVVHQVAAVPQDDGRAQADDEGHHGEVETPLPNGGEPAPHEFHVGVAEPLNLVGFAGERLHHLDAGQVFLEEGGHLGVLFLDALE